MPPPLCGGATEERSAERGGGPPTTAAPMRLTRSLRAGNREVNNLKSFGFPFRPRFVSPLRHEFFGFVSLPIKCGIVTISGPGKEKEFVSTSSLKAAQVGQIVKDSTGRKVKTLSDDRPRSVSCPHTTLSQSVSQSI